MSNTVARATEFLARLDNSIKGVKTPLNLVEASNWRKAKEACDNDNTPEKRAYLDIVEKGLGKRKTKLLDKIESICNDEIQYLILNYGSLNTVFPIITEYRNTIKANDSQHISLAFFKMPKSEYAQRRTEYRKSVKSALGDKRPYYDEQGMIEKSEEMLGSDSYLTVAMGLCLLTGRRPSEILTTAEFKPISEVNHIVAFSGQLKTKDSDLSRNNYLIPVLTNSSKIITALAKLRKMRNFSCLSVPTGKTLAQVVNSKTAKSQGEIMVKNFAVFLPIWTNDEGKEEKAKPYNLRQCYLDIVYRKFANGFIDLSVIPELKPDDKNMFCSMILGHTKDDLATVNSYMRVKYAGDKKG